MASHACPYGGPRGIKEENCIFCCKAALRLYSGDVTELRESLASRADWQSVADEMPMLEGELAGHYAMRLIDRLVGTAAPRCFTDIPIVKGSSVDYAEGLTDFTDVPKTVPLPGASKPNSAEIPDKGTPYPRGWCPKDNLDNGDEGSVDSDDEDDEDEEPEEETDDMMQDD